MRATHCRVVWCSYVTEQHNIRVVCQRAFSSFSKVVPPLRGGGVSSAPECTRVATSAPEWPRVILTPTPRLSGIPDKRCICIIQHSKQLLLHLRLFALLLLCYKNTSMHSPVQTFFEFFLYAAVGNGNDFFAVFQYTAYLRDCTGYLCGTELATRPGVLPGILRTCFMTWSCKMQKLFQSSLHFKNVEV